MDVDLFCGDAGDDTAVEQNRQVLLPADSVSGFGLRVSGFGFRVSGFRFWISGFAAFEGYVTEFAPHKALKSVA